eukprot:TRINITY_DN4381_c0_g2_i1.p1 TRINITY_DN4381_c0_g2~~TRINITY_DN4381_c0_g2_i1.p1  ORF type:complete len:348 (-),score=79.15 TRINITY_DN4381_c0_g2_i1:1634-2623(-)
MTGREERSNGTGGGQTNTRTIPTSLMSLYQNIHRVRVELDIEKITRSTLATLKVLIFFDACYFIASVVLICVGLSTNTSQKHSMAIAGGIIGFIAMLTFTCNSLAVHGLRTWKRFFLVPWLVLWLIILAILVFQLVGSIFIVQPRGIPMPGFRQALELIFCFCVFSVWCNMRKQFAIMAHTREELQNAFDVERMARDLFGGRNTSSSTGPAVDPSKDLPPKYEDCATDVDLPPPAYDVNTMVPSASVVVMTTPSGGVVTSTAVVTTLPPQSPSNESATGASATAVNEDSTNADDNQVATPATNSTNESQQQQPAVINVTSTTNTNNSAN